MNHFNRWEGLEGKYKKIIWVTKKRIRENINKNSQKKRKKKPKNEKSQVKVWPTVKIVQNRSLG